ncbi:vitamin K epoxide reductase family protein [Thermogemmatispora tikiterensis]|uniref:Vitamin K epoxide reductase domain-containing protein n=1 Tax=Thermogemmatispora tikiterensis TaxID=1825093 RepID=A0A328VFI3_9CHLR|nr:vitamin K epoxide reductase family protein [Thermogemmatispora tikiterensis]RAQ95591.1 hypothetical protein A4R35_08595 [Thermogemmatispora tikiterensis]
MELLLRRSGLQLLVLLLALVGIGDAIYLTIVHYQDAPLVCPASGAIDCAHVLSSSYAVVPGTTLPISLPGLGWCLILAGLALMSLLRPTEPAWLRPAQFLWSLAGMVTVLYLVYVELVRLHAICLWCTVLHVLILIAFLISLARWLEPEPEMEAGALQPSSSAPPTTLARSRPRSSRAGR